MYSFLSMEFLPHGQVLKSILLHYQGSNGRELPQLQFLYIVVNVVLTSELTLHPSGWQAHLTIRYLAFVTIILSRPHDGVHLQKGVQQTGRQEDNAMHP